MPVLVTPANLLPATVAVAVQLSHLQQAQSQAMKITRAFVSCSLLAALGRVLQSGCLRRALNSQQAEVVDLEKDLGESLGSS